MNICYSCKTTLDAEKQSLEHIIPNSLGGRLKSKKLLCIECNNKLGEEIDAELGRQLNPFMNLFMLDRERGKYKPIKGSTDDGEEFILDGIEIKSQPKIKFTDNHVSFSGNDEKDVKTYFKGLLKKYPNLNIDEIINVANKGKYYLNKPVTINMALGGESFFRAIAKIFVNFYLVSGGNQIYINNVISYIKGDIIIDKVWYNYEVDNENLLVKKDHVYHFIKIVGDTEEKILYGYIELFGAHKFLILLNNNYDGEYFSQQYFYDLLRKEIIHNDVNLNYSSSEIERILNIKDNKYLISKIQYSLQSYFSASQLQQQDLVIKKIIKECLNEVFSQKTDEKITKELLSRLIHEISTQLAIFLTKNKSNIDKLYF
ncbi:HNH endonuclease [Elizabethkingia meningoseptica]|uniref:HNH endonuclease n=1 Tax=Elizabethkingia meningoseptica TaxID=238 RepID=UPI0021A8C6B5|nr:HNH endonuclease [Elizabethkingia meningoseptica]MCT3672560.1 HNH endonuclease [Elizabethkingia anophelis]MCT3680360.1 HNH endonuclease [Elizabethkingia anophelis]MDE5515942.1 HNH endonuclease [Elizabethkingia meningoseptica]